MNSILIEVICPSLSRRLDFRVDPDVKAGDAKALIMSEICGYENAPEVFGCFGRIDLYNKNGQILDPEYTLREAGVRGGDSLMLI